MAVLGRSSDNPDFATSRFLNYPGLWVGAERHAEALAEVERLREALTEIADLIAKNDGYVLRGEIANIALKALRHG